MDDMTEEVTVLPYEPPKDGRKKIRKPDNIDMVIRKCMADPKYSDYDYGKYVADHGIESAEENAGKKKEPVKICELCGKQFYTHNKDRRFCSASCVSRNNSRKRWQGKNMEEK